MRAIATLAAMPGMKTEAERPDLELVAAAQKGDHRAFEALVRKYSERAFRAAYRVVRNSELSEDILQEAFLKAYRNLPKFESRSSFYTWFYRIVVNLALDRRRSDKGAFSLEWDDNIAREVEPRGMVPEAVNPELASQRSHVLHLVSDGMLELPEGQREVLMLREVDGLSYDEIAKEMKISKGTVMSRLHYARKKMIQFLARHGVTAEDAS